MNKPAKTASGASNLLHCADTGRPYTIEAWTNAGVVSAQAAFTFYPTVYVNCPGVANPNPWQNYFINDAKAIIPISWSQSATSSSNILLGNSTSYFWGFYNGYYAGETLLCTHVWFQAFQLSGTGITNSNITYTSNPDILPNAVSGLGNSVMSLVIGNQTVLKNYLTHELYPQFNPAGTGIAATFDVTATPGTTYVTGASKIRLEANPLIYPNITVACNLLVPPITVSGTWAVMCVIGRQGTIYSAGGPMGA